MEPTSTIHNDRCHNADSFDDLCAECLAWVEALMDLENAE